MFIKRSATSLAMLFLLAFGAACAPAATATQVAPEPTAPPDEYYEEAPAEPTEAPTPVPPTPYPLSGGPAPTAAPSIMQLPNGLAADDMFFQNYGVNPSIDTEDDNLSTFSLDVDTGSYTVARRYINDGSLPPKDAVRVEEFVNYFEQGYPNPPAHQA